MQEFQVQQNKIVWWGNITNTPKERIKEIEKEDHQVVEVSRGLRRGKSASGNSHCIHHKAQPTAISLFRQRVPILQKCDKFEVS